jgi:hypothetical protein
VRISILVIIEDMYQHYLGSGVRAKFKQTVLQFA